MRASRLVSMLLLLQTRGRMTAAELARELEVSERTIYRDTEALHAAGIPLYGDGGRAGGYRLLEGYRTRLTGLTADEARSLPLAGLPGAAADLGLGTAIAAARLKLLAALPADLREAFAQVRECFHVDAPGWYREAEPAPFLEEVAGAVWERRRMRVRYRRWAVPHEVDRVLAPYGLVLKAGRWYLAAAAADRSAEARTYRVSELLDVRVLEDRFARPAGFDLEAYWRDRLDDFEARRHRDVAVLRLSPEAVERLPYVLDPAIVRAARAAAGRPDPQGWTRATVPIESVDNAVLMLLPLGATAEVVSPPELRHRLAAEARTLATHYRRRPAPDPR